MSSYIGPKQVATVFNNTDFNYQDAVLTRNESDIRYAKSSEEALDTATLTAAAAANTAALSALDSAYTTSASSSSIDIITLKGKTAYMTPGSNTTISGEVVLSGTLNTNTCDIGKASNFIMGKTAGNVATISGTSNTVIGKDCGKALTSCTGNVICGIDSGKEITTGSNNTIVGYSSTNSASNTPTATNVTSVGYASSTLLNNGTAIGTLAHAGSGSVSLGYRAGNGCWSQSGNNICIGNGAGDGLITSANDKIYLGNADIDTFYCNVTSITSLSDKRDKIDISDIDAHFDPMDYINNLKPKLYKLNPRSRYKNNETGEFNVNDGSKANVKYSIGMIAQEVKEYEDELCLDNPLIYNEMNENTLALSYSNLIPILVGALNQANDMIGDLGVKIENLENRIDDLEN